MAPNNAMLKKKNSVIRLMKSASNKYHFLTVITVLAVRFQPFLFLIII